MICKSFTTSECVNGHCPVARLEEGYDVGVNKCSDCPYHTDCEDCDWYGTGFCPEIISLESEEGEV